MAMMRPVGLSFADIILQRALNCIALLPEESEVLLQLGITQDRKSTIGFM
jgi:hypothetical protein